MAYNQNGQSYPGHYGRYQQHQQQNDQQPQHYSYGQPSLPPRPPPRRSSFEAGDDGALADNRQEDRRTSAGGSHIPMPDHSQYMGSGGPVNRYQHGSSAGYPSQGSPNLQGNQYSHAPYNPQQYARAEPQYSGHSSYPTPPMNTSPGASYQPYVPAAYQPTTSPVIGQGYAGYSPSNYFSPTFHSTQAPVRMPHEVEYGQRPSVPSTSPYQQQQQYYTASPPGQVGSPSSSHPSAYTPPAPPPPPTSSDRYTSRPGGSVSYDSSIYTTHQITQQHQGGSRVAQHSRGDSAQSHGRSDYYPSSDYITSPTELNHSRRGGIAARGSPQRSPQRSDTSGRHPERRPLPGPPVASNRDAREGGLDDLLNEVEAVVMGRQATTSRPSHAHTGSGQSQSNGIGGAPSSGIYVNYDAYSDDSDAEAAAGLAAMRLAEEQDAADQSRGSEGGVSAQASYVARTNNPLPVPPKDYQSSSDSDAYPDMDSFGGVPSHYTYSYGTSAAQPPTQASSVERNTSTATGRTDLSGNTLITTNEDYYPGDESIHPFPAFGARTDTGGTGGLAEPGQRRMSFEDGDEDTLTDSLEHSSGATSPTRESLRSRPSIPDNRYQHQHSRSNSRPLPQIPHGSQSTRRGAVDYLGGQRQVDQLGRPIYPQASDEYENHLSPTAVQKANSVASHSSTPTVVPPGRSVTDAEQRRKTQALGTRLGAYGDTLSPDSAQHKYADILPTIPAGRRRKFLPSKLSTSDYKKCPEPWAESSILAWLKEMTEGEADLKEQAIVDGVVALFTHKVPTMNTADAEVLSARLVEDMFEQSALLRDEEWVKFGTNPMNGVIFQLTGTGCYSSRVHSMTTSGRCYSHHCMRTLKKVNLKTQELAPQRKLEDWATFYHLKKEDILTSSKKEIERQNNLHEIVTSEDVYMGQVDVLRVLYRDGLASSPDILSEKRRGAFVEAVFGKVDAIKQVNEDFLLAQLKYRQEEQGPWVKGFSDIFREWIRKAKTPYIEYAASFPAASLRVRKEAERNVLFRQFLDQVRDNARSQRLGWDTYLKAPITRLQRYSLLLQVVQNNTEVKNEESRNLDKAIEEIKLVTMECDSRVAEMTKRTDLEDLQGKLKLRPTMEKVELNLTHLGREVIFRGDLQRKGTNKVSWVDTHAILFDHYFVLAKPIQQRDAAGGLKQEVYDVSKLPIPMDLLVLESTNDEAVMKSSVKGIASVSTVGRTHTPTDRLARVGTSQTGTSGGSGRPGMGHFNTETSTISSGSSRTLVNNTNLDQNDKIMYPFRVKHLGKAETYVLYAPTAQNRSDWCDKIIDAKTRHAQSLFAQNAEPFRLRVVADTAFNYSDSNAPGSSNVVIKGTPLDRAIEECDKSFYGTPQARQNPICRSVVNCATTFDQPEGKTKIAIGTDFGVFISDYDNPRGWSKVAAVVASHVTQIAVLEQFSVLLVIADKSLIAYHLDSICPVGGSSASDAKKAPQKLSGNRDVGFFATGKMKERTLVFYKKKEGVSSTFKVLEPVYHKSSTTTRSRLGFRKGSTDFFRDYDDFYIATETYGINLFQSSLAVSSARGIEVLTLDKKVTFSIPDLRASHVTNIAQRIANLKPLGMFRLNDDEFLLVYEGVGIYVDKHGDVSRAVVMEFVGRARQATLYNRTYLILIDLGEGKDSGGGFVEVRNAINGRLRQVISGKDVRLLDDGAHGGTVKICLQHPEREKVQLVVEMIVNEGQKE